MATLITTIIVAAEDCLGITIQMLEEVDYLETIITWTLVLVVEGYSVIIPAIPSIPIPTSTTTKTVGVYSATSTKTTIRTKAEVSLGIIPLQIHSVTPLVATTAILVRQDRSKGPSVLLATSNSKVRIIK